MTPVPLSQTKVFGVVDLAVTRSSGPSVTLLLACTGCQIVLIVVVSLSFSNVIRCLGVSAPARFDQTSWRCGATQFDQGGWRSRTQLDQDLWR